MPLAARSDNFGWLYEAVAYWSIDHHSVLSMLMGVPKKYVLISLLFLAFVALILLPGASRNKLQYQWVSHNAAWFSQGQKTLTDFSATEQSNLKAVLASNGTSLTDNSPAEGEGLAKGVVDGVKKFVFFIGWSRSGHSIVAILLNAHPNVVISYEYTVLEKVDSKLLSSPFSMQFIG